GGAWPVLSALTAPSGSTGGARSSAERRRLESLAHRRGQRKSRPVRGGSLFSWEGSDDSVLLLALALVAVVMTVAVVVMAIVVVVLVFALALAPVVVFAGAQEREVRLHPRVVGVFLARRVAVVRDPDDDLVLADFHDRRTTRVAEASGGLRRFALELHERLADAPVGQARVRLGRERM